MRCASAAVESQLQELEQPQGVVRRLSCVGDGLDVVTLHVATSAVRTLQPAILRHALQVAEVETALRAPVLPC